MLLWESVYDHGEHLTGCASAYGVLHSQYNTPHAQTLCPQGISVAWDTLDDRLSVASCHGGPSSAMFPQIREIFVVLLFNLFE